MTSKEKYREMLEDNGYIDLELVLGFLNDASISDIQAVAEVFGHGMSQSDYTALHEAIEEIEQGIGEDEDTDNSDEDEEGEK